MALADLQEAGSNALVANMWASGRTEDEIYQALAQRFRDQQPNSLYAAVRRGIQAYNAGQRLEDLPPGSRVPVPDIPGRTPSRHAYRYTVIARLEHPDLEEPKYATFQVDSP